MTVVGTAKHRLANTKGEDKAHEVEKHHSTQVYERGKRAFFAFATTLSLAYALIKIVEDKKL